MVKRLLFVIFVLFIASCSGGSDGGGTTVEPLLINPETKCGVKFTTIERSTLTDNYSDSISGVISGVSVFLKGSTGIIVWGNGSTLKWGTVDSQLGFANVPKPDTITFIVQSGEGEVVFGTINGIGIAGFEGTDFVVKYYKELDSGIVTGIKASDGYIYFINASGQLLRASSSQIASGDCVDLVRNYSSWTSGENWYPTTLASSAEKLVVVIQNNGPLPAISTGVEPVLSILKEIYSGVSIHKMVVVGKDINTDSQIIPEFDTKRSSFIPTGLAFEGSGLLAAGFAYDTANAKVFAETSCNSESSKLDCLWNLALSGTMFEYKIGEYLVFANRLIKIDPNTNEIERIKEIYVSQYNFSPAPAFIVLPAYDGTYTHLRGTSYQLMLTKNDVSGWNVKHDFGTGFGDVTVGWPHQFVSDISGGAVASLISPLKTTAPSYSTLEHITASGERRIVDQASSDTKIVDYIGDKYIMVPSIGIIGGKLYIRDSSSSYFLNPSTSTNPDDALSHYDYYILNAAYDSTNSKLAYAWGENLTDKSTIKINVLTGLSSSLPPKGSSDIQRSSNAIPFTDFPTFSAEDTLKAANLKRGIADMKWNNGKLYILFYGYDNSKHYFRVVKYNLSSDILEQIKYTAPYKISGSSSFTSAKILKIVNGTNDKDTIYFSTPDGIYYGVLDEDTAKSVFMEATNLTDIAVRGDYASVLSNGKLNYKKLVNGGSNKSSIISSSTTNGSVALLSSKIFVALPSSNTVYSYNIVSESPLVSSSSENEGKVLSLPDSANGNILYFVDKYGLIGRYNF